MKFMKKNNGNFNNKLIAEITQAYGVSEDIVKLIISKGYNTKKEIVAYLEPQNFSYHNPMLLKGMKQAVAMIQDAIRLNKKITVLGDYDTDGICSTAIMYKYFEHVNIKVDYFLPNRFVDGYGLTMDTVDKIAEQFAPELLITVDCGISSYKEIEYAKQKGMQVIVTDHHEIPDILPDCVVIDPKQEDQAYPFKELCGAGVALKVVQALAGQEFANSLESIAAFATVADIVPLVDENRAIVYHGLKSYQTTLPKGVLKLIDKLKIKDLQATDISMRVAPKINTAGRMGNADIAFQLFIQNDETFLKNQINKLDELNQVRVSDGAEIYEEALNMLSTQNVSDLKAIVLHRPDWNGGVLGIVCARLVEKFNKPVCLLSRVENEYKGSMRSIETVDIYKQLTKLSDILIRFGGHSQAGGLSIKEEHLEEFSKRLNQNLENDFNEKSFETTKYYDLDLNKITLNSTFFKQLQLLEPFGFGNEKPVFKLTFNNARISRMKNYDKHLRIKLDNLDLVAWNFGKQYEHIKTNSNKDILLELNGEYTYNHTTYINAVVKNMIIHKLNTNVKQEICVANQIKQLAHLHATKPNNITTLQNETQLQETAKKLLEESKFGTLLVVSNFETYQKLCQIYDKQLVNYELFSIQRKTGENTILYAPNWQNEIHGFTNVIVTDGLLTENVCNLIYSEKLYIIDTPINRKKLFKNITTDRNVFAHMHYAIQNMVAKKLTATSDWEYYELLVKRNPQVKAIKFDQFTFIIYVFQELGLLHINNDENEFSIVTINKKNPLTNSKIYETVKGWLIKK